VVGAAHQVEAVAAQLAAAQVASRRGARAGGRQREVGLAAAHARDARVGQGIVQADGDARPGGHEFGEHRRQPAGGERRQGGDPHPPFAALDVVGQVGHHAAHVVEQPLRRALEQPPLGGELHAARVAVEQARAQRFLERADERAEGRLRQVAQLRRAGKVALLGQRGEGPQLPCREVGHLHGVIRLSNESI